VVDASVCIKLFIHETFSGKADDLFALLTAAPPARLHVPGLFFIECASILWKHVRRYDYPIEKAKEDLSVLHALALHRVSTHSLMRMAFEMVINHSITAYDACYVALAHDLDISLVTADQKLVQRLAATRYDVHWIGDIVIPDRA
jgi:predicted nucleic acid-binding protein